MLWFLAGLAIIPVITGFSGLLLKLTPGYLCGLAITEAILLTFLSIKCAFLLDKEKLADKYLKDQNKTWKEIESDAVFENAFTEAVKMKENM
jgi:hypothetical protein